MTIEFTELDLAMSQSQIRNVAVRLRNNNGEIVEGVIVDLRKLIAADAPRIQERMRGFASFYRDGYNEVPGIQALWPLDRSQALTSNRLSNPGVAVAMLVKNSHNNNYALKGALVGLIRANLDGFGLDEYDILVAPEYRGYGAGNMLTRVALSEGTRFTNLTYAERSLRRMASETYRRHRFPRAWYEKLGFTLKRYRSATVEEFNIAAIDACATPLKSGIKFEAVDNSNLSDLERYKIVELIRREPGLTGSLPNSDEQEYRINQFLNHHLGNGTRIMMVARQNGQPVGVMTGEIDVRRSGPTLTNVRVIVDKTHPERENLQKHFLVEGFEHARKTSVRALFASLDDANLVGIEVSEQDNPDLLFGRGGFNIRYDRDFVQMRARLSVVQDNLSPPTDRTIAPRRNPPPDATTVAGNGLGTQS